MSRCATGNTSNKGFSRATRMRSPASRLVEKRFRNAVAYRMRPQLAFIRSAAAEAFLVEYSGHVSRLMPSAPDYSSLRLGSIKFCQNLCRISFRVSTCPDGGCFRLNSGYSSG